MRYIYLFLVLMIGIMGFNTFLAFRDSELIKALESRKEQYCKQMQELQPNHPDCKVE